MKKIILISVLTIFDMYAFFQGKNYNVSKNYEDFYIKHTITEEQYAERTHMEPDGFRSSQFKKHTKYNHNHNKIFLP